MRKYELLCILKTGFDMETADKLIANIETAVKNMDGNIFNTNKIGRKKLAYEINKTKDGFYVAFEIKIDAEKVIELKRYLKLNESVLRNFITIKKEKKVKKVKVAS